MAKVHKLLWVVMLSCAFAQSAPIQGSAGNSAPPPDFGFPSYSNVHGLKVYRVGGSIKSPEPISCPNELRKLPDEPAGTVIISAVVDAKGHVRFPRIIAGIGQHANELALAQVRKWSFKPARLRSAAVAVQTDLSVRVD